MNFFLKRPLVCVAFTYLASLAIGCAVPDSARVLFLIITLPLIFIAAGLYIVITKISSTRKVNKLLLSCAAFAAIALTLPLFMFNLRNKDLVKYADTTARIKATVTSISTESSSYASFYANVTEISGKDADFNVQMFTEFSPQLSVGDIFVCDAYLESLDGSFYYSELNLKHENILFGAVCASDSFFEIIGHKDEPLSVFKYINREIGFMCDRLFSKNTASLAKALLLGDRDDMSGYLTRDFTRIGISHLLALSGMHLALFTSMIMGVVKFLIPKRKARFIVTILLALFIMLLTGAAPSIMRAALMVVFYQIGNLLRKQHDLMTTLFAVTMTIVLFDPYMIMDAGLILSFAATFGIALLSSPIRNITLYLFKNPTKLCIPQKILKYAVESVCISFAAGIFVNVAVIFIFNYMSLLTVFSTLIFTPIIVAFIVTSALTLVLNGVPVLSAFFTSSSELLGDTVSKLAQSLSKLENITLSTDFPLMFVFTAVLLFGFVFIIIKNKSAVFLSAFSLSTQVILLFLITLQINIQSKTADLTHFSLRDNEGFLLSNSKETVIIDNSYGISDYTVAINRAVLASKGTEIDKLIFTHHHFDYLSFVRRLSKSMIIREIYLPTPTDDTDISYSLDIEEAAHLLGIKCHFYSPYEPIVAVNNINYVALPYERDRKNSHPKLAFTLESSENTLFYNAGYEAFEFNESGLDSVDYVMTAAHGKTSKSISDLETIVPGTPYENGYVTRILLRYES